MGATEPTRCIEFVANRLEPTFKVVVLYNGTTHFAGTIPNDQKQTQAKMFYRALPDAIAIEAAKTSARIIGLQKELQRETTYLNQLLNGKQKKHYFFQHLKLSNNSLINFKYIITNYFVGRVTEAEIMVGIKEEKDVEEVTDDEEEPKPSSTSDDDVQILQKTPPPPPEKKRKVSEEASEESSKKKKVAAHVCHQCTPARTYNTISALNEHKKKKHGPKYVCPFCKIEIQDRKFIRERHHTEFCELDPESKAYPKSKKN